MSASSGMEEQPASSTLKVSFYWSISVAIAILARQRLAQDKKKSSDPNFQNSHEGVLQIIIQTKQQSHYCLTFFRS